MNLRSMLLRNKAIVVVCTIYVGIFISCGINFYSDQDDVNLGLGIDKEIRGNPKEYPVLQNAPHVKQYVVGITNKILKSPAVEKKSIYPYSVEIIKDDKTINAFCTPGGYIYVYTGLIKFLDNEASLAGVLGHEIAHAERRHATKRISAAYGVQVALAVALGQNPTVLEQIAANLFTNIGFLKNSRDDEEESDNYSMTYLRSTEYYPGAIRYFFDKIEASGKGGGGAFERLLSTHPLPKDRVENVANRMREWNMASPTEAQLFSDRYKKFRATVP